jgi:hypothetical protein
VTENGPKNFNISDAARAKIMSLLDDMKNFNPTENWVAAVIWSTSQDPEGNTIGSGPGIGVYPEREIPTDRSLNFGGLKLFFPGTDQSHFADSTLDFDRASNCFRLVSS